MRKGTWRTTSVEFTERTHSLLNAIAVIDGSSVGEIVRSIVDSYVETRRGDIEKQYPEARESRRNYNQTLNAVDRSMGTGQIPADAREQIRAGIREQFNQSKKKVEAIVRAYEIYNTQLSAVTGAHNIQTSEDLIDAAHQEKEKNR